MSQEVEIIEGARGRSFSQVNRIKTDKQDGGACFWVPENERRLTSLPAFQNGEYEPGNGYYAFDSVDASVMHFDDFDINIDDYDLPHIDLDGIDITIDETGIPHIGFDYEIVTVDDETIKVIYPDGKEVIIHGPDLDGLINIDDVFTIDYDKETGTWTITAIVDVTSGDNEFAPGDIVAQWPGTEHADIHIGQSISIPDLGDTDLDFDADIDVSLDLDDMDVDISGIDMDGIDVDVNIDLDTLDMNTFDLPDEIRIMHVPNKTSYKDGEEIDLDGLVVQAYRGGEVWEDKEGKYYNGYVPVHELTTEEPKSAYYRSIGENGESIIWGTGEIEVKGVFRSPRWEYTGAIKIQPPSGARVYLVHYGAYVLWHAELPYGLHQEPPLTGTAVLSLSGVSRQYSITFTNGLWWYNQEDGLTYWCAGGHWFRFSEFRFPFYLSDKCEYSFPVNPYFEPDPVSGYSNIVWNSPGGAIGNLGTVIVFWPRPHDHKILSASFNISVEEGDAQPSGNAGGTDGTPNGHLGGTTTSGDHGGSHSSGNF